jgi:hypothetical protein
MMIYLNYFVESITNYKNSNSWNIKFNHSISHDLDKKIKRTKLNEYTFINMVDKIINICKIEILDGDWVFVSFDNDAKIITRVLKKTNTLYIITFLGKDEYIKNTKNIKII